MIEIIPKPTKKMPPWQNIFFYFSLGLLMAIVLSYPVLTYWENKSVNALEKLEEQIIKVGTPKEKVMEIEVFSQEKRIKDFSALLGEHRQSSGLFQFLEKATHPKVWFFTLELDAKKAELVLSGKSQNFQVLGQQLSIFQKQQSIKKANLSKLSLGKEGGAEFTFNISLDPSVFK